MSRTLDDLGLKPNERAALEDLTSRLLERFGDRLVKLVVFGPKVRGDAADEPDIDVTAVIGDLDSARERSAVSSLRNDIDLEHGVFLQLLAYSEDDYNQHVGQQWPLFTDVEGEGVALHGGVSGRSSPTTPANRRLQAGVLMERAKRNLRAAESVFHLPNLQAAASSEACVGVLRAAQALVTARGSIARYFGEIVAAFKEQFVMSGDFDARFGKMVSEARRRHIACTHDVTHEETSDGAGAALGNARAFLAAAEKRLKIEMRRLG